MPTQIDRTEAIERVKVLTDWDSFPIIQNALVEAFVDESARPDSDGNIPGSDDWTGTYDINTAAALTWESKAALVANRYDLNTDGQSLDRSQLVAHFRAMAKMYRNRIASTLRRAPYADLTDPTVD